MKQRQFSPWGWIPTLYVAEALPYVAVNVLTVIMYTKMGIGLKEMAFFTGWLYLPWVIKPFWAPFVDIIGSKRKWVLWMQYLMAAGFAGVALMMPTSIFFGATLAIFWLIAFLSATHDIAADGYYMLELTEHQQAAFVGIRSTFYRIGSLIGQGGMVWLAGRLEPVMGEGQGAVSGSWAAVFFILSVFFLAVALYHTRFLPVASADRPRKDTSAAKIIREFGDSFVTFFSKRHIVSALAFMLLYRLPEALCIKVVSPFLLAARENGGLGMTQEQVGFANGFIGVIALLLGGILGGLAIAQGGLKKWLWPMAASLTLPCVAYCLLAMFPPALDFAGMAIIDAAIGIEQFGYGFGFTAFMLYLIYFSEGLLKTSHYAFCTAFMALGMMLPGMVSGWIFEKLQSLETLWNTGANNGFIPFFWFVVLTSLVTFTVCLFVKIDPKFGIKKPDAGNS